MASANPYWGAPRIHRELLKLGMEISERTVSRLMPKCRKPPSQTGKAFLNNHIQGLVSVDFFTVPTVSFRMLFVFVALAHHRRRVMHFNVTEHPTTAWTAQQTVEAFPEDTASRYLIRDRDQIYGECFRNRLRDRGRYPEAASGHGTHGVGPRQQSSPIESFSLLRGPAGNRCPYRDRTTDKTKIRGTPP